MENQISANQTDNRVVVPYDKGRKNITFYDTFVDINGDVIKYDDIAVIQSSALNSSSMIYFYFDRSFRYEFNFTTYDGKVHKFKRHGYSGYGIGTYKRIKAEFEVVAPPFYQIVVRKVGERLIDRIANGATANICGLVITKDKITYTNGPDLYQGREEAYLQVLSQRAQRKTHRTDRKLLLRIQGRPGFGTFC